MPFDPNTASNAGKKSKRGPAKKEESTIKQKMELLHEEILDDLILNQKSLTKTEWLKLFVTLSGYIFPKNKPIEEDYESENSSNSPTIIRFESPSKPTK